MQETVQHWIKHFPDMMVVLLVIAGSIVGGLLLKYLLALALRAY